MLIALFKSAGMVSGTFPGHNLSSGVFFFSHEVFMTDLDSALVYLIRREVPNKKTIKGEALEALINFTELLTKVGIGGCVRY